MSADGYGRQDAANTVNDGAIRRALYPATFAFLEEQEERERQGKPRARFAYYTSADTALKIVRNRELWFRDCRCMNDYNEVWVGMRNVEEYLSYRSTAFQTAVDACHSGAAAWIMHQFGALAPSVWANTYLMCLSLHDPNNDGSEDQLGRLSMWRAYGRDHGAAIVFKKPNEKLSEHLAVYLNPVIYSNTLWPDLDQLVSNLIQHRQIFSTLTAREFQEWLLAALVTYAVSLKHPGFHEELEWRLVAMPVLYPPSLFLRGFPETMKEVPQTVWKLDLAGASNAGVAGLTHADLFDRILIGPTEFPGPIAEQFRTALSLVGFPNARQCVHETYIPLRRS
jgi:hypothetical protein